MAYYPVMFELRDRPVLVIGGGPVARRKVEGLLVAGARVTVVSPVLTPALATLAAEGQIGHEARRYAAGDVAGFALVFVATPDAALTARVAGEGRQHGVWVNAADDPEHCDFILPAVLRRGRLTVSVATDGASPALAAMIRDRLATVLGEEYGALTELVAEVRRELREASRSPDGAVWQRALDAELCVLVAERRYEEARRWLNERLGGGR
jgi:siroheme synthase-like protein